MRAVIFHGMLLAVLLWAPAGAAQPLFVDWPVEQGVALELLADRDEGYSWGDDDASWYGVSYLSAVGPLMWGHRLLVELPLAYAREPGYVDFDGSRDIATTYALGNPFVGTVSSDSSGRARRMFGMRLPLSGEVPLGLHRDDLLHIGAFGEDVWTILALVDVERPIERLVVTTRVGMMLNVLGDGYGTFSVLPGVQVRYEGERFSMGNAVLGLIRGQTVRHDFPWYLLRRLTYQYEMGASLRFGRWQPGLHLRLPLRDEESRSAVLGLTLRVAI